MRVGLGILVMAAIAGAGGEALAQRSAARAPAAASRVAKQKARQGATTFVPSRARTWVPAADLAGWIETSGGVRIKTLGRARLITIYRPELRGGAPGFSAERHFGVADGPVDPASKPLLRKVESAYGEAVQAMSVEHISRPRPHALHDQAADALARMPATGDPVVVGRTMIGATVAGRDGWTKVLQGSKLPPPAASTTAKRSTAPVPWRALAHARSEAREPTLRVQRTPDGLAVVSFKKFSSRVASQVAAELADRPRGVVLDLRGNGGGWVREALELIGLFAVDDRPIAREMSRWRDGSETMNVTRARQPGALAGVPIVVLVDGNTASAAETTAASLRDTVGARVAGARTFGKGYAQVVHDLDDGRSIKITNGVVQAPRTTWHGRGLAVDIDAAALAKRGRKALAAGRDREMSGAFVRPERGDQVIAGALDELRSQIARP